MRLYMKDILLNLVLISITLPITNYFITPFMMSLVRKHIDKDRHLEHIIIPKPREAEGFEGQIGDLVFELAKVNPR